MPFCLRQSKKEDAGQRPLSAFCSKKQVFCFISLPSPLSVPPSRGFMEENLCQLEKINGMRNVCLTEPLAEQTRPKSLAEIIGQEKAVLQHLQQLVHLQWVKLPDFIYEQYAAVCLTFL